MASQFHDFRSFKRSGIGGTLVSIKGDSYLHPWDGVTEPVDPAEGHKQGKYSPGRNRLAMRCPARAQCLWKRVLWAVKSMPAVPMELSDHQDYDPLIFGRHQKRRSQRDCPGDGSNARSLQVLQAGSESGLANLTLHDKFYTKPEELKSGKGIRFDGSCSRGPCPIGS